MSSWPRLLGLPGAILAVANVDPEHAIAAFAGDAGAQQALLPAHNRVKARFPFGLKKAVADRPGTAEPPAWGEALEHRSSIGVRGSWVAAGAAASSGAARMVRRCMRRRLLGRRSRSG